MTSFSTVQVRLWPYRPLTQFQEEALVHDWHGALRSMGYQLLGEQLQLVIEREGELTSGDIVNVVWATSVLDGAVMLDVRAQSTSSGDSDLSELRLRVNCQWSSNNPQLWHLNFPHPSHARSIRWIRNSNASTS